MPFILGALANGIGGFTGDFLIGRIGLKWGRRAVGSLGMGSSAAFTLAAALRGNRLAAIVFLACGAGASDFVLPTCWATCLDVGKKYTDAITASMNTGGQISSFMSGVLFGYAAAVWKNYDLPITPMAALLLLGALLWLKIDSTRELIPEMEG